MAAGGDRIQISHLAVGVHGPELDSIQASIHHSVDCIASASSAANDFDFGLTHGLLPSVVALRLDHHIVGWSIVVTSRGSACLRVMREGRACSESARPDMACSSAMRHIGNHRLERGGRKTRGRLNRRAHFEPKVTRYRNLRR
jgi:hypothetical protein